MIVNDVHSLSRHNHTLCCTTSRVVPLVTFHLTAPDRSMYPVVVRMIMVMLVAIIEINVASGCPKFTPLSILDNPSYVKDDTMFLKCRVDVTGINIES